MRYFLIFFLFVMLSCDKDDNNSPPIINVQLPDKPLDIPLVVQATDALYIGQYDLVGDKNGFNQWKHQTRDIYIEWSGRDWILRDSGGVVFTSDLVLITPGGAVWNGTLPVPYVDYVRPMLYDPVYVSLSTESLINGCYYQTNEPGLFPTFKHESNDFVIKKEGNHWVVINGSAIWWITRDHKIMSDLGAIWIGVWSDQAEPIHVGTTWLPLSNN